MIYFINKKLNKNFELKLTGNHASYFKFYENNTETST